MSLLRLINLDSQTKNVDHKLFQKRTNDAALTSIGHWRAPYKVGICNTRNTSVLRLPILTSSGALYNIGGGCEWNVYSLAVVSATVLLTD